MIQIEAFRTDARMTIAPLSWTELETLTDFQRDTVNGPTNAQARLRLFGHAEADVRVTLYRDNHAWCPYCQKVWLWLEEKQIPYRIAKVTMFCYGEKRKLVQTQGSVWNATRDRTRRALND